MRMTATQRDTSVSDGPALSELSEIVQSLDHDE